MSKLHISDSLTLPIDAITQTVGILAKRRAGKSYTARKFAEQLSNAKQQVVIVDPKGDWWGIRSSADGKKPGLPIIILGGERADVPLEVNGGEVVAKLVAEERVSVLLDLSLFRKHEVWTFMTAFLENLYRIKAREEFRTPMMLIIDEADAIAPQKPMKGEERMLGAAEDIVRRGGQRGIGCTMITQRSAVLNKNVLTQIQLLVTLRTIAPQDLAAIDAWIDVHGTKAQREKLMASLPALPTGSAWFWSPGWPTETGIFKLVSVLPIETYDSGATPKPGQKRVEPKHVADVDLEALRRQMSATIERAKAVDPKELRKRIVELERELAKKPVAAAPAGKTEIKRVPVLKDGQLDKLVKFVERFDQARDKLELLYSAQARAMVSRIEAVDVLIKPLRDVLGQIVQAPKAGQATFTPRPPQPDRTHGPGPVPMPRQQSRRTPATAGNGSNGDSEVSLGSGPRKCAIAIAARANGVMRKQLTTLTGFKRSTRDRYLQHLASKEMVKQIGERFCITPAGLEWLGDDYEVLPTGEQLRHYWLNKLPGGQSSILRVVLENPSGIVLPTKEMELAA